MSTSWQYNTSSNMGSYGSVTIVPHPPSTAPPSTPGGTSNSQYGAWFGGPGGSGGGRVGTSYGRTPSGASLSRHTVMTPGSKPTIPPSTPLGSGLGTTGSGITRSPMRVLGNVPSATDKYGSMKTNTVSAMMGHPAPDPMEKFSTLANKFGAGRILTPITSQYDIIMQEEEDSKPVRKDTKTPIHSPEFGDMNGGGHVDITKLNGAENGYRKMTYKDDGLPPPSKDSLDNSYESRMSNLGSRRTGGADAPGFERSQTLLSMAQSQSSEPKGMYAMQRANTFTGDSATSRIGRDYAGKPLYPWRPEPHPPSSAAPSSASYTSLSSTGPSATGVSSFTTGNSSLMGNSTSATLDRSASLSLSDIQRAGSEHATDSAGSQRSTGLSSISLGGGENHVAGDSVNSTQYLDSDTTNTTAVNNNMYWLYGSRGRPPPTPFRPTSYMYRMDNNAPGNSSRQPPSLSATSDHEAYLRNATKGSELSPVTSPRSRVPPPSREGSDYSLYSTGQGDSLTSRYGNANNDSNYSTNNYSSSANNTTSYGTDMMKLNQMSNSNTKSILKKTSNYDTGFDYSYYSAEPRYGGALDSGYKSMSALSTRGPPGTAGSNKRVTFHLTPHTREISPREENPRDYMNMFSGFRFDSSSLHDYSDV